MSFSYKKNPNVAGFTALIFAGILFLNCTSEHSKLRESKGGIEETDENQMVAKDSTLLSVRNAHSMAYHKLDSLVYLFGGANEKQVLSDLWVWDGITWERKSENGPEPRTFGSLVYDHLSNRLVLFGGSKVLFGEKPDPRNLLNDMWEFKNNKWSQLDPQNSPSPRAESVMVYDEDRQTVVLFGGYTIQGGDYIPLGDTWEYQEDNWSLVSSVGPSPRYGVSMAYYPPDKSVILFGGNTIDAQYGENSGETWKWNGESWSKLEIHQPKGIFNAPLIFDKIRGELIRFGGWNGNSRINETWTFKNNKWDKLNTQNSPDPRNHSNMVYNDSQKSVFLFGGHDGENIFGDTWIFQNNDWEKVSESKPLTRIYNGH